MLYIRMNTYIIYKYLRNAFVFIIIAIVIIVVVVIVVDAALLARWKIKNTSANRKREIITSLFKFFIGNSKAFLINNL